MDTHKNDNDKISLPDHRTTDLKVGDIKNMKRIKSQIDSL